MDKNVCTYHTGTTNRCKSLKLAMDSCIQRNHIFKNIWTPTMGEQLSCKRVIVVAYWRAWASTSDFFL